MRAAAAARRLGCAAAPALLAALAACGGGGEAGGGPAADPEYVAAIDAWHAGRIGRLTSETGWLTLVGLHELRPGPNVVGSGPGADVTLPPDGPVRVGRIDVGPEGELVFTADPGTEVRLWDDPTTEPVSTVALATDAGGQPTVLRTGTLAMHVIDRGGRLFLRVKDTRAAALRTFAGIERFPVDPRWRVDARLEPGPDTVAMPNVLGQVEQVPSPGTLVFTVGGTACRLVPTGAPGEELFIVFGDRTNGPLTYPGGRFLVADPPAADGTVILDFNKAYNPPCAFSDYATCPLPPAGNVLPVAVTAGEKRWGGH